MVNFNEQQKLISWTVVASCLIIPNFISIPIWIQLIFNSIFTVSLGALYSITLKNGPKPEDALERSRVDDKDNETMKMGDALKFPFQASFALLVLYVLFNSVDNNILLYAFKFNFCCLGVTCLGAFFIERIPIILPKLKDSEIMNKKFKLFGEEVHIDVTIHSLIAYTAALIVNILYIVTDHWTLNNILGMAFTIAGITLLKVANFKIIFVLLWILFIYDIFWVFGSDVMVTVATKFDVPIKLKFPNGDGKFSILGLGDMVIPGIILALSLKFDVDLFCQKIKDSPASMKLKIEQIETPVYFGALIGYSVGILMTIISMYAMNHAQPALLFLVPGCTVGILIPVLKKKLFSSLFRYDSEIVVGEKEK